VDEVVMRDQLQFNDRPSTTPPAMPGAVPLNVPFAKSAEPAWLQIEDAEASSMKGADAGNRVRMRRRAAAVALDIIIFPWDLDIIYTIQSIKPSLIKDYVSGYDT
jgi:hypothetical protein